MKRNRDLFVLKFMHYFFISLAIVLSVSFLLKLFKVGQKLMINCAWISGEYDIGGMFFAQISTTFIVVSIVSILTSNTRPIYWDDVVHRKLLTPKILNFSSLTAFLMACLVVSFVFFIQGSLYIILPFVSSIVAMSIFTVKVLSSQFGRNNVKENMRNEFLNHMGNVSEQSDELASRLLQAINESDFLIVEENTELFSCYIVQQNKKEIEGSDTEFEIEGSDTEFIKSLLSECVNKAYEDGNQICIYHVYKGIILSHNWEQLEESLDVVFSLDVAYWLQLGKIWENDLCNKKYYQTKNDTDDGFILLCNFLIEIMIKEMETAIETRHFYSGEVIERRIRILNNKYKMEGIDSKDIVKGYLDEKEKKLTEIFKKIDQYNPPVLGLNSKYEFIKTLYRLTMGENDIIQKLENEDTRNPVCYIIMEIDGLRDNILKDDRELQEKCRRAKAQS